MINQKVTRCNKCTKMVFKTPIKKHPIDIPFGKDFTGHPVRGSFYTIFDNKHCGVDYNIRVGTPVFAAHTGRVVRQEFHKGMGNVIGIRNGNIVTLYAHLKELNIKKGKLIQQGDLVGLSGSTGSACPEPHLHFEARDIAKQKLKQMVFEPTFDIPLTCYKEEFTYRVKNTNTRKTLKNLSKLFFGTSGLWIIIKEGNAQLAAGPSEVLSQGLEIKIPNCLTSKS